MRRDIYHIESLFVIIMEDLFALVAIAPLAIAERTGKAWVEFIGASGAYEPIGFLYRLVSSLNRLLAYFRSSSPPLALERELLPFRKCQSPFYLNGIFVARVRPRIPMLELRFDRQCIFSQLSSPRRYDYH